MMKKCALINDLSGFGKCSLGAGIPIISVFGIEAHPLPTAVLSNQTCYQSFAKADMDDYFESFFNEWKRLGAVFNGILTGYFSDEKQVDAVLDYVKESNALLLVDPVMGDDGERYPGFSDSLCNKIKQLALCADIVTPNVTELALLTGEDDIDAGAERLIEQGIGTVIVTGIKKDNKIGNSVFTAEEKKTVFADFSKGGFSGTGDIFSAIVMGRLLCGSDVFSAVKTAGDFISEVIKNSNPKNHNDGIEFERFLFKLL